MLLETERLIIRKANEDDVDDLVEMLNDEVILKYNCIEPMNREKAIEYVKETKDDERDYVVEHKLDQKVIGSISLESDTLRYGVSSICLSYHLNTLYTGKGYMSEAVKRILKYCFEEKNYYSVTARVFTPNVISNNMVRRLGFTLEGTLKHAVKAYKDVIYDDNLYSLTKSEYEQIYKEKEMKDNK
jgi:ribosomal-protein-alanine N-acetyltransferase